MMGKPHSKNCIWEEIQALHLTIETGNLNNVTLAWYFAEMEPGLCAHFPDTDMWQASVNIRDAEASCYAPAPSANIYLT